jgi:hypothetical protein
MTDPDIEFVTPPFEEAQRLLLRALYIRRPCAICGKKVWCGHREPAVDLAAHRARMDAILPKEK